MRCAAGCDDLDSDGDGAKDICEDRYRPELVVRDAKIFRCDRDDTSRLCYNETVFNNEKDLSNFIEYEFPPTDDCSATNKLSIEIEHQEGTFCRESKWTITPWQDIPACNDRGEVGAFNIPFVNPLPGIAREVAVPLDAEAPAVACGFRPDSNSINVVDGKTLYHYMLTTDTDGSQLRDARFVYNVTVSSTILLVV